MKHLLLSLLVVFGCAKKQPASAPQETVETRQVQNEIPDPPNMGREFETTKPKVLILGDSISGGYTGKVIEILNDGFNVRHPDDNCRNSFYTLMKLDEWLKAFPKNSVIVWNNGLWDAAYSEWRVKYQPDQPVEWYHVDDPSYQKNIAKIAQRLKATGARIIFMTTTDISQISGVFEPHREQTLNSIARKVLPQYGIEIYDLYAFGLTIKDAHLNDFDVHFKNHANRELARFVADAILKK